MKRVLVSGANGFIGTYCVPLLQERGFEVHALSTRKAGKDTAGVHWHQIDLLKGSAAHLIQKVQASHFLHLAWVTDHGRFWTAEVNSLWLERSIQLANDFYQAGGTRFVTAGTCAEYDWTHGTCVEGKTPETPSTIYGVCKKAFTDFLIELSEKPHFSAACGRVFFLYGPGESSTRMVSSVVGAFLRGETAKCTDGNQVRDFLYAGDVADALVQLLCSDVSGPVNIASGAPIRVKDVVLEMEKLLESPGKAIFGAIPRGKDDPELLGADTRRLNEEVGWSPKVSLRDGLLATIDNVRSKGAQKL